MVSFSRLTRAAIPAALLGMALALPARADQSDSIEFDLSLRGLSAGRLSVNGRIEGNRYSANGTLKSTGIVGAIRKVRYDAAVAGAVSKNRFTPFKYSEQADTSKRQSESVMAYKGGVPQVMVYSPPRDPRPGDVNPATQGGTIDPLTALYAVLRDIPESEACTFRAVMFDGKRRSQIVLSSPETGNGGISCAGEYRRLEGFAPDEMAEKTRFPFRLTYGPAEPGRLRVVEVSMDTLYGKGRLKRR